MNSKVNESYNRKYTRLSFFDKKNNKIASLYVSGDDKICFEHMENFILAEISDNSKMQSDRTIFDLYVNAVFNDEIQNSGFKCHCIFGDIDYYLLICYETNSVYMTNLLTDSEFRAFEFETISAE